MKFIKNKIMIRRLIRKIKMPFRFLKRIWFFRSELWNFNDWDYQYNLALFTKSLELTAEFHKSESALSISSKQVHDEINQFINHMKTSEDPYEKAAKMSGFDSWDHANRTKDKEKFRAFIKNCKTLEDDEWNKGMDMLKNNMRTWWD